MGEYRRKGGTRRIVLHIAGDGPEIPKLREMAANLGVANDVVFHGFRSGSELDEIASVSDIAVCSLGLHRLGLTDVSPIKVREYMAQGFPMISARAVDISEMLSEHELLVPMDDSPVDMEEVIAFYDKKDLGNPESAKKEAEALRQLAYEYCDMKVVFAPAVEAFREG
jgi:glycosyltransferase involved in cell wall biosynthesis